ncbi:YifB family Mg chelatase-like AAA ATPase [Leucobacter aridicollis]|uniref:YifB family Mg chelatase-like AAA ATPase n=1 Tax=Leucobacter aridicollis TaxID=283878 RepID=UPI0021055C58|nr:YifB family Mg chelatase-like AAA ATPase [Leucobacter aridicollis]UTX52058.1 YifB family Mg chelatase-like AAA ATPase [Leucobacter aridicollis]
MSRGVRRAAAIALTGLEGTPVMVEAAVSHQLPGMTIIGLPDTALAESKQRVRTASAQVGLPISDRFVTVNLAPASLPKQGSGFDLAIALAVLSASKHVPTAKLAETAHIGELGLDGSLRRPVGLLSAVIAARELGFSRVMVPFEAGAEARLVPGIEVVTADTLLDAIAWHKGEAPAPDIDRDASRPARPPTLQPLETADMSDVLGQEEAVEAMVVAAAGRHHVSLTGPPGSGKTLLATRLAGILPDLSPPESLVASSIASLSGVSLDTLVTRPPFESPHHTASSAAIIGTGDSRGIRPGSISRASYGVLFMDEAPEFGRVILDDLREPLESGTVTISRARIHASLPAKLQLVLAANPCPCGNAGSPETALSCTCTPNTRMRYLGRLSGPLIDRIDLRLNVRRVSSLSSPLSGRAPTSNDIRGRVIAARARAQRRLRGTPWTLNGEVPGEWLRGESMRLPSAATTTIDRALALGALTVRGYDRILRVHRTTK